MAQVFFFFFGLIWRYLWAWPLCVLVFDAFVVFSLASSNKVPSLASSNKVPSLASSNKVQPLAVFTRCFDIIGAHMFESRSAFRKRFSTAIVCVTEMAKVYVFNFTVHIIFNGRYQILLS